MKKILVIGDVHGKIDEYYEIIQKYKPEFSIQVGDFGFKKEHEWFLKNIDFQCNKINFGNHDDYNFLKSKHSLGNWLYYKDLDFDFMTIRGADSIDKNNRIEGISWWRNEELSYQEINKVIAKYMIYKPSIMITHDCPQSIREKVFGIYDKSITSTGLQIMLEYHKPKLWIFGHHHKSVKIEIGGTIFQCLNELEVVEIEI